MNKLYEVFDPEQMLPDPANQDVRIDDDRMARRLLGAWRWAIMRRNADKLVPLVSQGFVIDFGGSAGPVGYGSIVVDHMDRDRKALYDIRGFADCIFTSHTLEHIADLPLFLASVQAKLRPGGTFIVVVPHCSRAKLRASNWPFHEHTFSLSTDETAPPEAKPLDAMLARVFRLNYVEAEHDSNILIVAQKPEEAAQGGAGATTGGEVVSEVGEEDESVPAATEAV